MNRDLRVALLVAALLLTEVLLLVALFMVLTSDNPLSQWIDPQPNLE